MRFVGHGARAPHRFHGVQAPFVGPRPRQPGPMQLERARGGPAHPCVGGRLFFTALSRGPIARVHEARSRPLPRPRI